MRIGDGVFVVAYGNMGGAERLWWLLRHFGHDDCAVLDLAAWHGPLRAGEEQIEPAALITKHLLLESTLRASVTA